jgi:hypothetical protein
MTILHFFRVRQEVRDNEKVLKRKTNNKKVDKHRQMQFSKKTWKNADL